jgi:hypothetical protein
VNWGPTWTPIERQTPRRITVEAQRQISVDLTRAARDKDFLESDAFVKNAPSLSKRIDLPEAFGFYCDKAGIKGGATGPTAKRWRPKIAAFCEFVGHSDLCRMTSDDAYRWVDHLTEQGIAKKSIREVWIASLRAVAGFQIERGKLTTENPFSRIRVRGVKPTKDSNKKGFSDAQAEKAACRVQKIARTARAAPWPASALAAQFSAGRPSLRSSPASAVRAAQ